MSRSDLETKVLEEIQLLSEERLAELYDIIHAFQLASNQTRNTMQFAGCWNDLPDETYAALTEDMAQRRQAAFSERRTRETSQPITHNGKLKILNGDR
jgi:hypothetical protein